MNLDKLAKNPKLIFVGEWRISGKCSVFFTKDPNLKTGGGGLEEGVGW